VKKTKKQEGLFRSIANKALLLCFLSALIGIGCASFFFQTSVVRSEKNRAQQASFSASKRVLDNIDLQFASRFTPIDANMLKTKLAQKGYVALIEESQIETLYGYTEIEHILANKTEPKSSVVDPQKHTWPSVKLISFVLDSEKCTMMVEFFEKDEKLRGTQKQIWRWVKNKNGQWQSSSFAEGYTARDIELNKEGISFILSPKNNPRLSNLYVLKKK
jgi:hypothetical protein